MTQISGLERQTVRIVFLSAERSGDVKFGHNRSVVDVINLHLVDYLLRVLQRFREVAEYLCHFFRRLEPLLLGVMHPVHIVDVVVGAEANKPVMCLCVLRVDEVGVVGADDFDTVFLCQSDQYGVHLFLAFIYLRVSARYLGLMALQLDVVVVAENVFEPLDCFFCFREVTVLCKSFEYFLRQFASEARRGADDSFVVLFQQLFVNTRCVVIRVGHVSSGHDTAEVMVAHHVFCQ